MFKKMVIAGVLFASTPIKALEVLKELNAPQPAPLNDVAAQQVAIQDHVAHYNEWKINYDKEVKEMIAQGKKREPFEDVEVISIYIHLKMIMREDKAKLPAKLGIMAGLAQAICPSYKFWEDYYKAIIRCERGKRYSPQENVELILAPEMEEIALLKKANSELRADGVHYEFPVDWKKETESLQAQVGEKWQLRTIIPYALPPKRAEIERLKQENDRLSQPQVLRETLARKVTELARARHELNNTQRRLETLQNLSDQKVESLGQQLEQSKQVVTDQQKTLTSLLNKEADCDWKLLKTAHDQLQEEHTKTTLKIERMKNILALGSSSSSTDGSAQTIQSLKDELGQ